MSDSNRNVRILVVDADASASKQICESLFNSGFTVQYSASAARALVMARRGLPNLMIVAARLDGCSGAEFVDTVRAENRQHEIPVIFLSKRGERLTLDRRDCPGTYHLNKPVDMPNLLEQVDEALWMPHLVRCHIDFAAHPSVPKAMRAKAESQATLRPDHS